jgi:PAS domain S-box-containing protein
MNQALGEARARLDAQQAHAKAEAVTPARTDRQRQCDTGADERSQAEAPLSEGEWRFRAIVENAHVGVTHSLPDGRFDFVNRTFCEMLGYTAEQMRSKTWRDLTHPDDLAADLALSRRLFAGEIPYYTLEKRYIRQDGSIVWAHLFANYIPDGDGRPCRGVGIVVDLTERKRAERALRDSQESLWLAKHAARIGTFDWDLRSNVIQLDERTYELWGIEPSEPITFEVLRSGIHRDDRTSTQRALERAFDPNGDGQHFATYRVIHRVNGTTRWVEATGRVSFEAAAPARMVGIVQDVTDRKFAEEKLRASEERFRELANNIDQFAWTCDDLSFRTWYNDRWYEYTGTTFEEMRGEGWKRVHDPAHLDRVVAHLQKCMQSGRPWEDTYPLRGKDGRYRWFLSRAVPIRDASGRVVRWFGTDTDVTELRLLQEAQQEADRRRHEFLAMLAHELRNPVAPIRSAAEVLLRRMPHDEQQRPLLAMVQRQAGQLARLLDDLLDAARVSQGRIELRRELLAVSQCIALAVEMVEPLIREKHHRLLVTQLARPLYVYADRVRLTQCIANVLTNAAKYTDPGGEIRIDTCARGDELIVAVSDTGVGISAELLPRVFERFVQNERALDRSQGGLGIGLSICKQLIEMHAGRIVASSHGLGRGSTFSLSLPLAEAPDIAVRDASTAVEARHRVLIVDDNRDAADSLAMLLQLEGHETKAVYSAEEALEQAVAYQPETVLLDIGLPRMDGYEVARRIKAAGVPVRLVALTGYGQPEDRQRSAAAGFDVHLVKPVEAAALAQLLGQSARNSARA